MTAITIDRFDDYFQALHGRQPYAWQHELAASACEGRWPSAIDLPTGSGKTACIDIALFALACQAARPVDERRAPRRIFFCVNRRIIVDEACQRSRSIAQKLASAEDAGTGVLSDVAAALRALSGESGRAEAPPVDVLELRGGIHRDNRWARSATQPTIICTTIDQLGSRLLFRGYGVSPGAAPIQAALVAFDSLVLLDEAHISSPFQQTLAAVSKAIAREGGTDGNGRGQSSWPRPMLVVPMTATPAEAGEHTEVLRLGEADRRALAARLGASKPARMREVREVVSEAVSCVEAALAGGPAAVGVIVNRVDTARRIHQALLQQLLDIRMPSIALELVIGSMRPLDRDEQTGRLRDLVGPARPAVTERSCVVVATQCLEVGADFDFDVLITEAASLDALRQRFGRLNRGGRAIEAQAHLLAARASCRPEDKLKDDRPLDHIYGNAAARTWNWLSSIAVDEVVDFGIDAMASAIDGAGDTRRLLSPSATLDAPVLLPTFIDFWCQTAPKPNPDPDIAPYLHGDQSDRADVLVCWRSDLDLLGVKPTDAERAIQVVSLLPPTTAECMSVPIGRLRSWLMPSHDDDAESSDDGDLLASGAPAERRPSRRNQGQNPVPIERRGVLWRGAESSRVLDIADDLRPGDTLVLPIKADGWNTLGYLPDVNATSGATDEAPPAMTPSQPAPAEAKYADRAEEAFELARARVRIRVCRARRAFWPDGGAVRDLFEALWGDERPLRSELRSLIASAVEEVEPKAPDLARRLRSIAESPRIVVDDYPDGEGAVLGSVGIVGGTAVIAPGGGRSEAESARDPRLVLPPLDDGDDDARDAVPADPVSLEAHTADVVHEVRNLLKVLPLGGASDSVLLAAELHDLGKADERFQAVLNDAARPECAALLDAGQPLLAKSGDPRGSRAAAAVARRRAELPPGFRHEMLSAQLSMQAPRMPSDPQARDLVLHLIESHHGHARPFAPIVPDDDPPDVSVRGHTFTSSQRRASQPHRIDSGVADRFWRVTRRLGWWHTAYLESVLRLADQQASQREVQHVERLPALLEHAT